MSDRRNEGEREREREGKGEREREDGGNGCRGPRVAFARTLFTFWREGDVN